MVGLVLLLVCPPWRAWRCWGFDLQRGGPEKRHKVSADKYPTKSVEVITTAGPSTTALPPK